MGCHIKRDIIWPQQEAQPTVRPTYKKSVPQHHGIVASVSINMTIRLSQGRPAVQNKANCVLVGHLGHEGFHRQGRNEGSLIQAPPIPSSVCCMHSDNIETVLA